MVPLLSRQDPLPPPNMARDDMNGLLAVGGGLEAERLLNAYHQGIFPWGTVEGHPLWYSPNPRMVLLPEEFRLSRSLR
ncbi:MAG: leucyl/phenylalanyl-tRNA--protein transferase, partial [Azonexus sp.]|nr:leucyl/phenylalanyl-tRNA--protein transferase [Azonexus sp.]